MRVIDFIQLSGHNNKLHIEFNDDFVMGSYDDNSSYLIGRFSNLLCSRVVNFDSEDVYESVNTDNENQIMYTRYNILVDKPNIMDVIIGFIKFRLMNLNLTRYNIAVFLNRIFYDKYYIPYSEDLYDNMVDRDLLYKYDDGKIYIYSENIKDANYKQPVFRVGVYSKVNDDKIRTPLFSPKQDEYENIDSTMVFTLEENPKPLQKYEDVSRRLNGNIISRERLDELVNFVSDNYYEFIKAWYVDTRKVGTLSKGYDETELVCVKR
jgi:hypothetical protein